MTTAAFDPTVLLVFIVPLGVAFVWLVCVAWCAREQDQTPIASPVTGHILRPGRAAQAWGTRGTTSALGA